MNKKQLEEKMLACARSYASAFERAMEIGSIEQMQALESAKSDFLHHARVWALPEHVRALVDAAIGWNATDDNATARLHGAVLALAAAVSR